VAVVDTNLIDGYCPHWSNWFPITFAVWLYGSASTNWITRSLALKGAMVHDRLFETPTGITVLQVLEEDILAVGTTDPLADVATQAHVTARMSNPEPTPDRLPTKGTGAPLAPVYGELPFCAPVSCSAWLYVADVTECLGFKPLPSGKWRS